MSTTNADYSPYVAARREWDERYGDHLTRAKNWRTVALIAAITAVISGITAMMAVSRASHVSPFVAVIDGQGHTVSMGFADGAPAANDTLKRANLVNWISNLRLVTADGISQRKAIDAVFSQIASGSEAQTFIADWERNNPAFTRAQSESVSVDVTAVLPTSNRTYEIDWTETTRDLYGVVKSAEHWKASVQILVAPPSDEAQARSNPLGVYVTNINWSKVL